MVAEKPKGKKIVLRSSAAERWLTIRPISDDAVEFIKTLDEFGKLSKSVVDEDSYVLFVYSHFDFDEVLGYIKSYNDLRIENV